MSLTALCMFEELPWERASEEDPRYAEWCAADAGGAAPARGPWRKLSAAALALLRRALRPAPAARPALSALLDHHWLRHAPGTRALFLYTCPRVHRVCPQDGSCGAVCQVLGDSEWRCLGAAWCLSTPAPRSRPPRPAARRPPPAARRQSRVSTLWRFSSMTC